MKKNLLMLSFLVGSIAAWGQRGITSTPYTGTMTKPAMHQGVPMKTVTCQDTLHYPYIKQYLLGNPQQFSLLVDIWQADNESVSQTFMHSGVSMNITGVEFWGMNAYDATDPLAVVGTPTVTVRASVYAVDASNTPTTSLGSGTINITSTSGAFYVVNFATPVVVTGNYAIVLDVTNANGVFSPVYTNSAPNQTYDELNARFKSNYYTASAGNYVTIPTLTSNQYNCEPIVAPIVNYSYTATATATPDPSCLGTAVTFTGSTNLVHNRMNNFSVFRDYFGPATVIDSSLVWDMTPAAPTATAVWSATHNYTYATAGTHDAELIARGGFWSGCVDIAPVTITVNPLPIVNAGSDVSFCPGGSTLLDASGATTYSWDNGLGAGETHTVTPAATTTYTVTGTDANGCQNTDQVMVTVTALDNASFTYPSNTICEGSANVTPTAAVAGTFSSTAGLMINSTTGEIDVANSTSGSYTVTHSVNQTCANTSTQTITITAAPEAGFSYANADYCAGSANPVPSFDLGASAGTFTSTAGLSINAATGEVNIPASTAGTYTVTNTIAASGSCPASSSTTDITINAQPTAAVSGGGTICGTGTSTVTITLAGEAPFDFTYTDGTTPVTVTAHATNTYTITASAAGTYTVTAVSDANCSNVGTGSAQVTVFSNPTVSLAALPAVCSNGSAVTLTQGTPAGGTYTGTGVTGSTFTPSAAGTTTITYAYTDANGCTATATGTITVEAAPTVALTALADVCSYVAAFPLSGGTPAGGTYSGPGVSAGSFNPATAGVGTHTITYTYANTTGLLCAASTTKTITVKNCADVAENELENSLLVYPNPADESVTVSFESGKAVSAVISMISLDGKLVYTKQLPQTTQFSQDINVSAFPAGIYLIQIQTANGSATRRITVQ